MAIIGEHVHRAKAVVVSWPEPYQDLLRRFPEARDRLFMIPFTTKSNIDVAPLEQVPGVNLDQPFLFFPAVISPRKNHENLIRAYAVARERGVGLPPVVFSGGGDAALQERLIQLCDSLGVSDRFTFLGYVSRPAISTLYRSCLATVAPTLWEAGMATIQEGGYWAKPAACSDIPPAREHASMLGMDVCFFDPEDPADIAAQLGEFVANIDAYRESARAASTRIRAFDDGYLGRCYLDVFAFAAGLAPKPEWQPFLDPTALT
jgi:glycosyltransferase involved in cell wall biosynthesis